jgi:hypothetical protein
MKTKIYVFLGSITCATSWAGSSFADPAGAGADDVNAQQGRTLTWHPEADQPTSATPEAASSTPRAHSEERPFAYVLDPTTPSRGDASVEYRLGLASGVAADRPLPSTVAVGGVEQGATFAYGVTDRFTPFVSIRVLDPEARPDMQVSGSAGARLQLTRPDSHARLALAGAAFREFEGGFGGYLRVAASYDIDRLRLAANVHGEHVFQPGRDALDVLVFAGASYKVMNELRFGVEYVGQDLEETFDGGAEGGARHYLGPNISVDLIRDQLQLVAIAARGINGHSPPLMGTLAALVTF